MADARETLATTSTAAAAAAAAAATATAAAAAATSRFNCVVSLHIDSIVRMRDADRRARRRVERKPHAFPAEQLSEIGVRHIPVQRVIPGNHEPHRRRRRGLGVQVQLLGARVQPRHLCPQRRGVGPAVAARGVA